jgi:hypothetical protein
VEYEKLPDGSFSYLWEKPTLKGFSQTFFRNMPYPHHELRILWKYAIKPMIQTVAVRFIAQ